MDAPAGVTAKGGGPAPLALRAFGADDHPLEDRPGAPHPPGYFGPDEGAAGKPGSLFLWGVLTLAGLWGLVRVVPALSDLLAALAVLVLGALIALPAAWGAAVRRGHGLGTLAATGRLRAVVGGGGLRVALAGLAGMAGAAALVTRLVEAGPVLWGLAVLALPLTWGLMAWLSPRVAPEAEGLHARRLVHLWSQIGAVTGLLMMALGLALLWPTSPPVPAEASMGAPLVAEALALARLWAGLEAYALGQAAEFGGWGRAAAALVSAAALVGVFWALSALAVTVALPWAEWRRAVAPASDAPAPPAPGRLGPGVAVAVALAVLVAAGLAGRHLGSLPPEARPSARAQVVVEVIGEALYSAGTRDQIDALRRGVMAEDAAGRAELRAALNAGFDAMEGNVETFLDEFYSLSGEYGRLIRWALGSLEDHMTAQLTETLQAGGVFAGFEATQARVLAEAQARAEGLARTEAAVLAANRIEGVNPARLRVAARHGIIPLPPPMLAADLARAQARWGASAGAGVIAVAMARRVAGGLAARGLIGTAARVALRAGGVLLAFGVDYALVKLDEYQNRDEFRDAILAEIAVQRALALGELAPLD